MFFPEISWETLKLNNNRFRNPPFRKTKSFIFSFSGGADSMLATFITLAIRKQYPGDFSATLFYIEHGNRDNARQEILEQFSRQMTQLHPQLLLHKTRIHVEDAAKEMKTSWEHAASLLRKRQLYLAAEKTNAMIVKGHHLSDWSEAIAMRATRATSDYQRQPFSILEKESKFRVLRPLANWSKQEVLQKAQEYELRWWEDPENYSGQNLRSQIRRSIQSQAPGELRESARKIQETFYNEKRLWLQTLIAAYNRSKVKLSENEIRIEKDWLSSLPKNQQIFARLTCAKKFSAGKSSLALGLPKNKSAVKQDKLCIWLETYSHKRWYVYTEVSTRAASLPKQKNIERWGDRKLPVICLAYGTKSVKKIFSELKISTRQRQDLPVQISDKGELQKLFFSAYGLQDISSKEA